MKKQLLSLFVFFLFSVLTSANAENLPAFPGAVGFGSLTKGGRGGQVYQVTNLNDSGTGSFRSACEASGRRIIIFRTGGIIRIKGNIQIKDPYITIAGQTSPGDGICIRGAGLSITTHDVIVRGLRIRVGDDLDGPDPENRDAIQIGNKETPSYNIIIDHCSLSWSIDELCQIWFPGGHDITLSNCIFSEALYHSIHPKGRHPMGPLVGQGITNVSYIGNLMAHNGERNPRLQGSAAFINNVVYNRDAKDVDIGSGNTPQMISVVGNSFIKGPSFGRNIYSVSVRENTAKGSKIYVSDNISTYTEGEIFNRNPFMVDSAPLWPSDFIARPASGVTDWVLSNAGALAPKRDAVDIRIVNDVRNGTGTTIDCTGSLEMVRNSGIASNGSSTTVTIDKSSTPESYGLAGFQIAITSGTGAGQYRTIVTNDKASRVVTVSPVWDIIPGPGSNYKIYCDCKANAGGWPVYASGDAPADTDNDGIPDDWEKKHGLNPDNPTDANMTDTSSEGYTYIETYINR